MKEFIEEERQLLNVKRMSSEYLIRGYDLAQHSYFVASMFIEFCERESITISSKEIQLVMRHDIIETMTGDLLYPAKNRNEKTQMAWEVIEDAVVFERPEFKKYSDKSIKNNLSKEKWDVFKACDLLELALFCKEEIILGNSSDGLKEVYNNCQRLLKELTNNLSSVKKFIKNSIIPYESIRK